MKRSEYEIVCNQLSHIKYTTESAIRALELNLSFEYKVIRNESTLKIYSHLGTSLKE